MALDKLTLPKFTGEDFAVWKSQIESILVAKDLIEVLTKGKPRKMAGISDQDNEEKIVQFEECDKKVRAVCYYPWTTNL